MNYRELTEGHPLPTPEGVGIFQRFKEGNFKEQNVLVLILGRPKWFSEAKLNKAKKEKEKVI